MFKKKQIYHVRNVWAEHQEEKHSENEENDEECDIVISNDEEKFDTNKKNDWIDNDLNESNDLKKFETLQESKNIEFTNEVNE
jgi:hypothetical protein